jgi:hypothetical protein
MLAQLDVGLVPRHVLDVRRAGGQPDDLLGQRVNGEGGARVADVEGVADRLVARQRQGDAVDDIVHVAPRADLRSVVVDGQRLAVQGAHDEVMDRPLADLARAVDVEWPDGHRGQLVLLPVVHGQVLGGQLGHRIGPARFADRAQGGGVPFGHVVGVAAKDLAGGKIDDALHVAGCERGLEHVHGA